MSQFVMIGENVMETQGKNRIQTIDLTRMGLFVALLTVCSWISIPAAVPFTMQTFAVFVAVAILGCSKSVMVIVTYILLGMVGLPVFSGFKGGPGVLLGTTGGYIIGFIFTALLAGGIIEKFGRKVRVMLPAMILGMLAYYTFGTIWFILVYTKNTGAIGVAGALSWCVIPFIVPDCIKAVLAILLEKRVRKYMSWEK